MTVTKLQALLELLLYENEIIRNSINNSRTANMMKDALRKWIMSYIHTRPYLLDCCTAGDVSRDNFDKLNWKDIASLRILDYLDHAGIRVQDPSISKKEVISDPFGQLYDAISKGEYEFRVDFVLDMIMLFRQFSGKLSKNIPSKKKVMEWISRHPSGLDPEIVALRNENKARIIRKFIELMENGKIKDAKFFFEPGLSDDEKYAMMLKWWQTRLFHLRFAIRDPEILNEMLDHSISGKRMKLLRQAKEAGIPTFVNPHYLTLLNVNPPAHLKGTDEAIREYVFYSKELVNEFGNIVAWEMEDIVLKPRKNKFDI